jgi:hypothetical protein
LHFIIYLQIVKFNTIALIVICQALGKPLIQGAKGEVWMRYAEKSLIKSVSDKFFARQQKEKNIIVLLVSTPLPH